MTGAPSSATYRPRRPECRRRRPGAGPSAQDRPYAGLIDAWLAKQPKLKASVIYERLVAEYGFQGHYQRVKLYVRENRERVVGAPAGPPDLHRRFEVLPGAQAQKEAGQLTLPELAGWAQTPAARIPVARRDLFAYDLVGGLR